VATEIRPEVLPARPEPPADKSPPAIADPGPLGLAAFAMTTFELSMFNADIISAAGVTKASLGRTLLPVFP